MTNGRTRVGDEAAARELRSRRAVVHQREVGAGDVETAHRHGLRNRPEVRRRATAVLPERVDIERQVGERAPEVDERDAVARAPALEAAVVHLDLAVDRHIGRRGTQTGDLGVVAHLDLQRLGGTAVDAGLEQERIAVRPHLGVDLLRVNRVEGRLDLPDRHARVEHDHVRPERSRRRGRRGSTRARTRSECEKRQCKRQNRRRSSPCHGLLLLPGLPRRQWLETPYSPSAVELGARKVAAASSPAAKLFSASQPPSTVSAIPFT